MYRKLPEVFLFCLLVLSACSAEKTPEDVLADSLEAVRDSIVDIEDRAKISADSMAEARPKIVYQRTVVTRTLLDSLRRACAKTKETWTQYRVLTLLNRKDLQFFRVGDTIVLPDIVTEDALAYSVFPYYYEGAKDLRKLIVISNTWQSYACYEYGKLVRFAAANTGEERKPTFPGRYAAVWKQRKRISSLDSTWILPFTINIHQYAGSAMHQFEMPGRPVSHSCVRQFLEDAEWVYRWVGVAKLDSNRNFIPFSGTPIIIHGLFDFSRKRGGPWLDIANNGQQINDLPNNPMDVEPALIPISQIPKAVRGALPNREQYVKAEEELRKRGWIREHITLRESIDYNKLRQDKRKNAALKRRADSVAKAAATPDRVVPTVN